MKNKLIILAGSLAWLVAGATLVTNVYVNHQRVVAASQTSQQKLVDQTEAKLQNTATNAQKQVRVVTQQLAQTKADETKLCNYAQTVQSNLVKYKINLGTTLPSECQ